MPNSIAYAQNYTNLLDEVYQRASVSGRLASPRHMVRQGAHAREIMIPKISVTGLGDYRRNVGYVTGSIEFSYESHQPTYDRGVRLYADVMDADNAIVPHGVASDSARMAPDARDDPVSAPARSPRSTCGGSIRRRSRIWGGRHRCACAARHRGQVQAEIRSEVRHILGLGELVHLRFVHEYLLLSYVPDPSFGGPGVPQIPLQIIPKGAFSCVEECCAENLDTPLLTCEMSAAISMIRHASGRWRLAMPESIFDSCHLNGMNGMNGMNVIEWLREI